MKVLFLNPLYEMAAYTCLSSYLKKYGHQTCLVNDPKLFENNWVQQPLLEKVFGQKERILREIQDHNPDLIGITVVHDDYKWALNWSDEIKKKFNIPIVWGNTFPTFHPKETLNHNSVDYIVRGEGEQTLLELVEELERPTPNLSKVKGIGYKDEAGKIRINLMRPLIMDLDILPFPDKDLYYDLMPYLNKGYTTMSGRGCPYRCTFCDNTSSRDLYKESGHKQKWTRRHSPERMIEEIRWAKQKYNIQHIRFNDEDFSYSKKWIKEFANQYIDSELNIPYFAWVYPNTIDDEIAGYLAKSGCDSVEMGIQSASERLRMQVMQRNTKNEQIYDSTSSLQKAGIHTTVDLILGNPTETKKELDDTVEMLLRLKPDYLYAFWLKYYPSTKMFEYAKANSFLTDEEVEKIQQHTNMRGHLAGGTSLEKDSISRSYHSFISCLPILPYVFSKFMYKNNLIRFWPAIPPVVVINISRLINYIHAPFNEFIERVLAMIKTEIASTLLKPFRFLERKFKKTYKRKQTPVT